MIKQQRVRHFQIWIVLSLLLPIAILSAWLVIPDAIPVKKLSNKKEILLPVIKDTRKKHDYKVNIRSTQDKMQWQLEWLNKHPLKVPSAVIYRTSGTEISIINAQLIGRVETKGNYVFALTGDALANSQLNFILYDFIHNKVIDSLTFKIPL